MSDLKPQIQQAMKAAMLGKQKLALTTIRMLLAQIKQVEIDNKTTLDDAGVMQILQKMIKQRKDAIAQFEAAARQELAEKEQQEINCLMQFLPKQLDATEIETQVDEAIKATGANDMKDMGKLMAYLKPKLQGKADMSLVSKCIKQKLS